MSPRWPRLVAAALLVCTSWAARAEDRNPSCPPEAAAPTAEQVRTGLREARDRGFLWRIDKGGHRSYLYGTLHVGRPAWIYPGPHVLQAMRASDTVALEVDLLDPEMQRAMHDGMTSQPPLALPEPLKARLAAQIQAECLTPAAMAQLGPEMQVATLSLLVARRDGLDPAYAIDLALDGFGHGAGKQVVSLETPALQLAVLQAPDPKQALEAVESGLDDLESGRAKPQLLHIASVWEGSDFDQLSHYASWCDCLKTDAERTAMRRLLDDRNPGLADAIDALHARGRSVFAAVGSLHMIGPQGLPELLARRGYTVERVAYGP
ncbi:MAG: TraB/GumN family protein [Proteobacteria bacterium]|nr:TraB/GumN family protein [Pseudomonadota bacterium]